MNWIDLIRPYTHAIEIDDTSKTIRLVHPHFKQGTSGFRALLRALRTNPYHNYKVEATGFMSLQGMLIIRSLLNFLQKYNMISIISFNGRLPNPLYSFIVRLK